MNETSQNNIKVNTVKDQDGTIRNKLPKPTVRAENIEMFAPYGNMEMLTMYADVYGHPKFKDGDRVVISKILKYDADAGVVETRNTIYKTKPPEELLVDRSVWTNNKNGTAYRVLSVEAWITIDGKNTKGVLYKDFAGGYPYWIQPAQEFLEKFSYLSDGEYNA